MIEKKNSSIYQRIYSLVQQIPPGYVSSYGRIGREAGCTARTVGFALAATLLRMTRASCLRTGAIFCKRVI